jgi:hypothetical protein
VSTISKARSAVVPRSPKTVGLNLLSERCSFSKTSIARVLVLSLVLKKKRPSAGFTDESGRQTTMGQPKSGSVEAIDRVVENLRLPALELTLDTGR